ncbi:MAG: OmpH family outer membrane protein [Planctomycetota bacterium]|jgi:Skp family chaperone for outer membrane proteins
MSKRKIMLGLLCLGASLAVWSFAVAETTVAETGQTKVRVGVFDSRAVAIAYAHSEWNEVDSKMAELQKARAAGDTKKIKELEAWGPAQQARLHKQGFGTASVSNLLKHIKDDIPKIAKETGVDIIVSKWDIVYQNPSVKLIDITNEIVKPFKPSGKTLKSIRGIQTHPPVSAEVLETMKCEPPARKK